ncbi:phage minor tail protein G [Escherichia coli]|nr:phage minor tail protein G [Escherichia coli]
MFLKTESFEHNGVTVTLSELSALQRIEHLALMKRQAEQAESDSNRKFTVEDAIRTGAFLVAMSLWPELMNLLVTVTHIFHLIQVCQQTVPILHRQIFLLALWLFSTVMRHRGISLKTIGVKPSMTWLPATRYLFLNLAHYRKMSPGCRREGSFRSGTAQPG